MSTKVKLFATLFAAIALFFSTYHPAEAANPIKSKDSRVTFPVKDANGVAYKVYFAGQHEKRAVASYNSSYWWAQPWAGINPGDVIYRANYTLYTQKASTTQIKTSEYSYPGYNLNATRKMVHIYPSKYKGQPDIIAVAETESSSIESADWYYIKNGALTKIVSTSYSKRAMIIGKHTYRIAGYNNADGVWYFSELDFYPEDNYFETFDINFSNPTSVINNWKKHWR